MSTKLMQYIWMVVVVVGFILALASAVNPELNELLKSMTL